MLDGLQDLLMSWRKGRGEGGEREVAKKIPTTVC